MLYPQPSTPNEFRKLNIDLGGGVSQEVYLILELDEDGEIALSEYNEFAILSARTDAVFANFMDYKGILH